MSDVEVISIDFNTAIKEYKSKQQETMRAFFSNVCELGEILSRHRAALKPQSQWTKYLDEVGLTIQAANQQIRLFEYAQKTEKKKLLEGVITNWAKCNLFLALEEDQREELLDNTDGTETTAEFREKISEIKGDEVEVSSEDEDMLIKQLHDTMGGKSILKSDPKITAAKLAKGFGVSDASIPIIEALLYIVIAQEILTTTPMPEADKAILNNLVKEQQQAIMDIKLHS